METSLLTLLTKEQYAVNRIRALASKFNEELRISSPNYAVCRTYLDEIRNREEDIRKLRGCIAEYYYNLEEYLSIREGNNGKLEFDADLANSIADDLEKRLHIATSSKRSNRDHGEE